MGYYTYLRLQMEEVGEEGEIGIASWVIGFIWDQSELMSSKKEKRDIEV